MSETAKSSKLPSLQALEQDVRALGHEAADLAREKIIQPAADALADSKASLDSVLTDAETVLAEQRDKAADWIARHPFTAIGLAVGAGLLLGSALRKD